MSEYLSKKAVLEWFGLMHLEYSHNTAVSEFIESGIEIFESGAFDADTSEIQRLRAALEEVRECIDDFWDRDTPRRLYKEVRRFAGQIHVMEKVINQALSTATESTGQKDVDDLIGDRIDERCPKCGADLLANKVGDKWCSLVGCDYSINAPEGGGNDA